jgi:tetratricopeptide (TPR) repeat protein
MKQITLVLIITIAAMTGFSQSASDLYRSAKSAYGAEEYLKAVDHLDEAISLGKQGNFYKLRGDCFQKMRNFSSALADYDFAERRGCTDLELNLNRGICRISMGLFEQAQKDLNRHLDAFPDDAKAHYYLGEAAFMMFENKASVAHLYDALMIDDDYMEAHYLLGANYSEMGKMNLAEEEFQTCRRLRPEYMRIDLNLAILALDDSNPDEAIGILSRIVPDSDRLKADVHFYLGEAYYALHDKDQACAQWLAAGDLGDSFGKKNHENICLKQNGRHKKKKTSFVEF